MSDTRPLTILCHNVFWFQGVPFDTDQPPDHDPRVLKELCDLYRGIDPGVLCLQEIQSPQTFEAVSGCLHWEGAYCPGSALMQYGGALLWRKGQALSAASPVVPQRMWQGCAAMTAAGSITICNIHLPSNRQLGTERSAQQRLTELTAAIDSVNPSWDVVAGDFNERPGGAVGRCLRERGYRDAAELTGKAELPTNLGGGRGDAIWVAERMVPRLVAYGVARKEELAIDMPGKRYLSDHLPLWITVA